jgi:hypothetical protein
MGATTTLLIMKIYAALVLYHITIEVLTHRGTRSAVDGVRRMILRVVHPTQLDREDAAEAALRQHPHQYRQYLLHANCSHEETEKEQQIEKQDEDDKERFFAPRIEKGMPSGLRAPAWWRPYHSKSHLN